MPLWGRKLYQPRGNEKTKKSRKPAFQIPFTQEVFESKSEYKEQLQLYQQPLWTCQSTGESGLTYEEAHLSEITCKRLVKESIPTPLRRAVLQFVHHSTGTLETVLNNTEDQLNSRFQIGETVELLKCKGKLIKGKILQEWTDENQACNGSPSSDKENHSLEPELISNNNAANKLSSFYNIQISGREEKVISSVPASDLIRCNDLPSRDQIQLLIRSHALQAGTKPTSPWVVTPDIIKELDLRNKLIEAMLPSTRISIRGLKGEVKLKRVGENMIPPPANKRFRPEHDDNGSCNRQRGTVVNGNRTPSRDEEDSNDSVVIVDTEDRKGFRGVKLTPSPEKVYLDHSYSSPKTKAKKLVASPNETPRTRSPAGFSTTMSSSNKRHSAVAVLASLKNDTVEKVKKKPKKGKGRGKGDGLVKESFVGKSSSSKKKTEKERRKSRIEVVDITSDSDDDSEDDSSDDDSSDSDIVLIDLSRKLSPHKSPPVRRTLTDHFLSMSTKRASGTPRISPGGKSSGKSSGRVGGAKYRTPDGNVAPTKVKSSVVKSKKKATVKRTGVDVKKQNRIVKKTPIKSPPIKQLLNSSSCSKVHAKKFGTPKKSPAKKISSKTPQKMGKSPLKPSSAKSTPKKVGLSAKKTGKSPVKKTGKSPAKTNKSPAKPGRVSPSKSPTKKKLKGRVSPTKKQSKILKQVTLFNFAKKRKVPEYNSSDDDALILYKVAKRQTPPPPREPPIAAKLMKAKRINDKCLYGRYVGQAAKMLTTKQIQMLKSPIQRDVMAKAEAIAAKLKWMKMTPEEKKKILAMKRDERKKKICEQKKKRREEEKAEKVEKAKRYEDQSLTGLTPLVIPKPVVMPEGLPNTLFGDIVMVVEFLSCYSGLLMPNDPYPVTTDSFMKALVCGKEGFAYLSRMLVSLLKTLLQDQITEEFTQLGVKLSDIPVNMHTASELLRLSLLQSDEDEDGRTGDNDSEDSSVNQEGEFTAPQELVEQLETVEFFSLQPDEKLELMACFCSRIMATYSLVDFLDEKQKTATKLWNEKMRSLKLKNDLKKEEKKKRQEEREAAEKQKREEDERLKAEREKNGVEKTGDTANGKVAGDKVAGDKVAGDKVAGDKVAGDKVTGDKVANEKVAAKKPSNKKGKKEEEKKVELLPEHEPDDLASIVKRRRILAARAKVEQEEQAKKDRERRILEHEELKILREKQSFERTIEEGMRHAKMVLRRQPIGTDRNHSRYWLFSSVTPGLFIEKGWVSQSIDYRSSVRCPDDGPEDHSDLELIDSNEDDATMKDGLETSIPKVGQNLWFQYDTVKELDGLLESLDNHGIRDSALYMNLKKRYSDITKHIFQSQRCKSQLRDSDGPKELLDSFREDLKDIEVHIRQGNLGGVGDFDNWEKSLEIATTIQDLGTLLLESQARVNPKFLEGMMAPPRHRKMKIEEGEAEENEEETGADRMTEKLSQWIAAVGGAQTMSRLHVLLSIYEVCIKWDKSLENAKCKICRKKGDVGDILLCDDCNRPFHLFCLRPALLSTPKGEWKCPACAPTMPRVCRKRDYKDLSDSEEESKEEEEEDEDSNTCDSDEDESAEERDCCVCGIQGETVACGKCHSAYHKDCHKPRMRNFPRGGWTCYTCLHAKSKRLRPAVVRTRNATKKTVSRTACVSEEEEEDEDESAEERDCCVCGIQGETVACGKCHSAYHKDCHEPPMRNFPRGSWTCYTCLHAKPNRRKPTAIRTRNSAKNAVSSRSRRR